MIADDPLVRAMLESIVAIEEYLVALRLTDKTDERYTGTRYRAMRETVNHLRARGAG